MSKAIGSRLDRIMGRVGWRITVLTDQRGREMNVRTVDLIDAWLAFQMTGVVPATLPRRVSLFLAGARLRLSDGELLIGLRDACRQMWGIPPTRKKR